MKIQDELKCTLAWADRRTDAALWSKKFTNNFKKSVSILRRTQMFLF